MSKILNLKRWFPVEYDAGDGYVIGMELKRLRFDEANRLLVLTTHAFGALSTARDDAPTDGTELSLADKVERLSANAKAAEMFYQALKPETMAWIWAECVRNVSGLKVDEVPITTGVGLAEEADTKLVMWILVQLQGAAGLRAIEGKGSSSPSTSGSEGATLTNEGGASPVTSTGNASDEGSTATASPN